MLRKLNTVLRARSTSGGIMRGMAGSERLRSVISPSVGPCALFDEPCRAGSLPKGDADPALDDSHHAPPVVAIPFASALPCALHGHVPRSFTVHLDQPRGFLACRPLPFRGVPCAAHPALPLP